MLVQIAAHINQAEAAGSFEKRASDLPYKRVCLNCPNVILNNSRVICVLKLSFRSIFSSLIKHVTHCFCIVCFMSFIYMELTFLY